jgi:hypothetical protein
MASQVQTAGTLSSRDDRSRWLDWNAKPTEEARKLLMLVGRNDNTVESVRELIAVPPETEAALLLYAQENPEDAPGIERVLQFRHHVAKEFERLAAESCGAMPLEARTTHVRNSKSRVAASSRRYFFTAALRLIAKRF